MRFRAFNALKDELESAKSALKERKIIDRAKALLMKSKNISEEDAYAVLRRAAMNQHKRMGEVAESLISAYDLLKG